MYVNELIDSQFTLYMGELERELEKKEAFEFQKLKKKEKRKWTKKDFRKKVEIFEEIR